MQNQIWVNKKKNFVRHRRVGMALQHRYKGGCYYRSSCSSVKACSSPHMDGWDKCLGVNKFKRLDIVQYQFETRPC